MTEYLNQVEYKGEKLESSIRLGQRLIDNWSVNLLILKIARLLKRNARVTSKKDEAEAIRGWAHDRIRYVSDPARAEMIGDPLWTLKNGGDCDDMTVLVGAILAAIGHQVAFTAVKWKGREYFSHAVLIDFTAGCIIDPVPAKSVYEWPPVGFEVDSMRFMKGGEIQSLNGLFGKLHESISKVFTKVFKPNTLLGKVMDPLGLSSRNLKTGKKVADVAGTAVAAYAAVVSGGGLLPLLKAGASIAGKAALTTMGTSLVANALQGGGGGGAAAPSQEQTAPTESQIAAQQYGTPQYSPSYGGGGGGSSSFVPAADVVAPIEKTWIAGIPNWAVIGAGAVAAYLLFMPGGKK